MSSIITLGKNELLPNGYNNTLRFDFSNSSLNMRDAEMALVSMQLYNSTFNIDQEYDNTSFRIKVPTVAGYQTVLIELPDGYYSYSDLSNFIQQKLISIGAYLLDPDNRSITHIRIRENKTYYSCQIDCLAVPNALPSGWSLPSSGLYSSNSALPTVSRTPQIEILTNGFRDIVGYEAGLYPSSNQSNNQSFLSTYSPSIHPVSSYLIHCNLVSNAYSNPPDILYSFTSQGKDIGQQIDVQPSELAWVAINDGAYSNITIEITDQDNRYITIHDPSILISVLIRARE